MRWPRGAVRRLLGLCLAVEAKGKEHLPASGACIVAANHLERKLDAGVLWLASTRRLRFVTHQDLLQGRLWRPLLNAEVFIPVEESLHGMQQMVEACVGALGAGELVTVFPEGRGLGGGEGRFQAGAAYLSYKAQVPVVPARIDRLGLRRYRVHFGSPLPPPQSPYSRQRIQALTERVQERIRELA